MATHQDTQSLEGRYIDPKDWKEHDQTDRMRRRHSPLIIWGWVGGLAVIALFGIVAIVTSMETPPPM